MPEIIPNWHPMFVHFTLGLLAVSAMLYAAAFAAGSHPSAGTLRLVARANLYLGVLFTIGTVLTGWYAYNTVPHDGPSHQVMTIHRNWALFTATVFALLAIAALILRQRGRTEGPAFTLLVVLAAAPLTVTGFYGGELVYRHGVGVLSLPDTDGHTHNHDHGHDHGHDHDHDHDHDHGHDRD
ncbi:MAG: DUF2231 domain-containing protein [Ectothiorhodospiraceae bacterium]|nr:DUF2231 domain-containing protein [Ectothiorhodospiraceae bacterium]